MFEQIMRAVGYFFMFAVFVALVKGVFGIDDEIPADTIKFTYPTKEPVYIENPIK